MNACDRHAPEEFKEARARVEASELGLSTWAFGEDTPSFSFDLCDLCWLELAPILRRFLDRQAVALPGNHLAPPPPHG